MTSQDDFVQALATLLNELTLSNTVVKEAVDELWCQAVPIPETLEEVLPGDLIVQEDQQTLLVSALGVLNTALVRSGGEHTYRLIAVLDDTGRLRFEAAPYSDIKA